MKVVDHKTQSRRRPLGGGGFDAEKPRQKLRFGKGGGARRFRLIVSAGRDKRAKMSSARKRHDCEQAEARLSDARAFSERGMA